ncbi:proprotein convertase P-domain-containing protein [Kaistella palustris]|uniref:proprotein convertase P-domain-containing protein n=1 Tax=Kaistella palustris TaxID=493376 RepID=UPI00040AC599|nr:proprotein convertase P-domain-containing protein [Kaistella palustris]
MKNLYLFAMSFLAVSISLNAQTYQNTTATVASDATARISACGFGTQPGVTMSAITIPLVGTIADPNKITVNLSVNAEWLGDVVIELVSPAGQALTLIRRIGGGNNSSCGDSSSFIAANILGFNSSNTALIDAAAYASGVAIPAGNYAPTYGTAPFPQHHPGNMTTFLNGRTLNGEWRLIIYDYGVSGLSNINSWQIIVGAGALLKTNEGGIYGSEISLQQNPVQDYLRLNVQTGFKNLVFEIYDAAGQVIKKENMLNSKTDFSIDVKTLSPGMYLLVPIQDGVRKQTIKFIKK